jgi:hypothetical protein
VGAQAWQAIIAASPVVSDPIGLAMPPSDRAGASLVRYFSPPGLR